MKQKGYKFTKSDIRYMGINDKGYVGFFRRKKTLLKRGFTYIRKMYKCKLRRVSKDKIPTITAKEPKFNIRIQKAYIVNPDGIKDELVYHLTKLTE